MSFEKLSDEELLAAASMLAVNLESVARTAAGKIQRKEAAAAFAEEGVTWDIYQKEKSRLAAIEEERAEAERAALEAEAAHLQSVIKSDYAKEKLEEIESPRSRTRKGNRRPEDVLVKMDRRNPHYEVNGKVFTKEHPFVVMSEREADQIFMMEEGFRLATGREAAEYYS